MATERAKARQILEESGVSLQAFLENKGLTEPVQVTDWLNCNIPSTLFRGDKHTLNNPVSDHDGVGAYIGTATDGVLVMYVNSNTGGLHLRGRTDGVWTELWFSLDNPNLSNADNLMGQFRQYIDNATDYITQVQTQVDNQYNDIRAGSVGSTRVITAPLGDFTLSPGNANGWTRVTASNPYDVITVSLPEISDLNLWPEWPEIFIELSGQGTLYVDAEQGVTVKRPSHTLNKVKGDGSIVSLKLVDKGLQTWMMYGMMEDY